MKLRTKLYILGLILLVVTLTNLVSSIYRNTIGLYNTTITYKLEYQRTEQELVTFYDAKYLAFSKKDNIAQVNKDAFIAVTSIIMNNRKDGEQLAWKWVQENQQIPYSEFTVFYKDLSAFVDEQYSGIFDIEKRKQLIVNRHNQLLLVYPNNVFNSFLHIPPIQYKYGYVSDSTRKLFNL